MCGKVKVDIVAEGSNGLIVCDFLMKDSTVFGKLMTVWCLKQRISLPRVRFMYSRANKLLKSEDTPAKLGLVPGDYLVIWAFPLPRLPWRSPRRQMG